MKYRLLDLIVCPKCHGTLTVESFKEERVQSETPGQTVIEIIEGALHSEDCGASFPIINGIPRLLDSTLLVGMRPRYPEFFLQHPEFLSQAVNGSDSSASQVGTLESFTNQHVDLRPPGPEQITLWKEDFERNIGGALGLDSFRDKLVLDVGCGYGRHLYVASQAGAEAVGIDISGGVDTARQNNLNHPRCHIVQANILDHPFRGDCFDVVWSFGVLHHMPDPHAGFDKMASLARPDGGLAAIWVYGYRGMAFTYRLSHMRPVHRLVRKMPSVIRIQVSKIVAALLLVLYLLPLRIARRIGLRRVVERMPLTHYLEHNWIQLVGAAHDRVSPPYTHFHDRDELTDWFRTAGLTKVVVEDTNRRGWHAHGWRVNSGVGA